MFFERLESLHIGRFAGLFANRKLCHGFSTRRGGCSDPPFDSLNLGERSGDDPEAVRKNRERFLESAGIPGDKLAIPRQVHSDEVRCIDRPGVFEHTDGLITRTAGVILSVLVADCIPVFIHDPQKGAVGLVHAGWRGTRSQIAKKAVEAMVREFGSAPKGLQAWMGPSIGPCCYDVGQETARLFSSEFTRHGRLDLWRANRAQLEEAGLEAGSIDVAGLCTRCHPEWFFSHRGSGGQAGRMMAILGIQGTSEPLKRANRAIKNP